jgi:hypothetical protein
VLPPLSELIVALGSQKPVQGPLDDELIDSDDEREAAQFDQRIHATFQEIPLCAVFVSCLPRDALVEVEFMSIGKALGDICLHVVEKNHAPVPLSYGYSHRTITTDQISRDGEVLPSLSPLQQLTSAKGLMLSMPIWDTGYRSPSSPFPPVVDQPALSSDHERQSISLEMVRLRSLLSATAVSYSIYTHCTTLPSSFSIGYSELALKTESDPGSLLHICFALFHDISHQIIETKSMTWKDLKTLKLFYPVSLCPFEDIRDASVDALRLVSDTHGTTIPSSVVQIIPSSHRPQVCHRDKNLSSPPLCVVQFVFLNFLQIKSELWIASRENR